MDALTDCCPRQTSGQSISHHQERWNLPLTHGKLSSPVQWQLFGKHTAGILVSVKLSRDGHSASCPSWLANSLGHPIPLDMARAATLTTLSKPTLACRGPDSSAVGAGKSIAALRHTHAYIYAARSCCPQLHFHSRIFHFPTPSAFAPAPVRKSWLACDNIWPESSTI